MTAFEEFVAAGWPGWVRRATLLTGDLGRGEDLLQEALVKLWRAWPRVWDQAPDAYLWRVLVRLATRAGRRRWTGERPSALLPDTAGVADAGRAVDERDFLLRALARLPDRERAVLVLRYHEDLADTRIAELLVYLIVYPEHPEMGPVPAPKAVTINGRPGELRTGGPHTVGPAEISLTWERRPGQWVGIIGHGRYATEASMQTLAAAIVDEPQPVPLQVRLAPAGWALDAFKDDSILTLQDTADPSRSLSVQLVPRMDPDIFQNAAGARHISTVQVNGRASLIKTDEQWFLQAPLPDGSAFNLQAPLFLTQEQVIAIGEQISRT